MTEHKSVSLADIVFQKLEQDILGGRYAYGEILTETRLCDELGVSRTPVREAIRRLEQENILRESSRGIVVQGITEQDIEDITEVRIRLEGLAARRAAERMSDEQKNRLKETVDLQEFYMEKSDGEHIQEQDHRFHEDIYAGCGSVTLQNTLKPLHRKEQKFRRSSVNKHDFAKASVKEHRAICDAVLASDGDRAEQMMIEHIKNAGRRMLGKK